MLIKSNVSSSLLQTLTNARPTLITVTQPRSASTQQAATPVPAPRDTGSSVDSARVSEGLHFETFAKLTESVAGSADRLHSRVQSIERL